MLAHGTYRRIAYPIFRAGDFLWDATTKSFRLPLIPRPADQNRFVQAHTALVPINHDVQLAVRMATIGGAVTATMATSLAFNPSWKTTSGIAGIGTAGDNPLVTAGLITGTSSTNRLRTTNTGAGLGATPDQQYATAAYDVGPSVSFDCTLTSVGDYSNTWNAVDLVYSAHEPERSWLGLPENVRFESVWPTQNILSTSAPQSILNNSVVEGILFLTRPGSNFDEAPVIAAINTALGYTAVTRNFGRVSPISGFVQLELRDVVQRGLTLAETPLFLASDKQDLAIFSLEAIYFDPAAISASGSATVFPLTFPQNPSVRIIDIPSFVTIPGGWWSMGKGFNVDSADGPALQITRMADSCLRSTDNCSSVTRIPDGCCALLVRSWGCFDYADGFVTSIAQLALNVW